MMFKIADILVALVAALHVYFLILEMFFWTKPLGLKIFRNTAEKAADSAVLAANQGLYNGFLAAGLVWGLVQPNITFASQIKVFFLLCVIVAGIYGAATVSYRILLVQAAPAALALALFILAFGNCPRLWCKASQGNVSLLCLIRSFTLPANAAFTDIGQAAKSGEVAT